MVTVINGHAMLYAQELKELKSSQLIFPLHHQHNHAAGIAELPNGDLFVSWYRGSGERKADDVALYGARLASGSDQWSAAEVIVDTPGFPDGNTCLLVDRRQRLWLFWPVVLANSWDSCLTNYRIANVDGALSKDALPNWSAGGVIYLKPEDFSERARALLDEELERRTEPIEDAMQSEIKQWRELLGDKLHQRLGWQPRCKPLQLDSGRILLPLYSDTYSISIMAISDDDGASWYASQPLIGFGNIQPALMRRNDGTVVAFMRENGTRGCIRVAESRDDGVTWGPVEDSKLPNPGSGLDGVRLHNGHWLLVYNDAVEGRNQLAVSISEDEGRSWTRTRHLERHETGQYHYPAVVQGRDGTVHVVYSYFVDGGKSMKYVAFDEAWVGSP
jgi:predicted neuraminidase